MFAKMAFRNIKNKLHDYLIYLLTLTALATMMLSASMLELFPTISDNESGNFMSNSLPALITLTLLFLMLYMNRFMLKRRSREFAIYMLSGVPKDKIGLLYFVEHALLGLIGLAFGLLLGLLFFWAILTIFTATWTFSNVFYALLKTCAYFTVAHVLSLFITIFYIKRLNIKALLYHHNYNEQRKLTMGRLLLITITTAIAFLIFFFQIYYFSSITASTLVFTIGFSLYGSYTSMLGWIQWYRERQGDSLYYNRRLFIAGQFLSKIKTLTCMSAVVSGCLLCAMCSFIAGWIFVGYKGQLLGKQDDIVMGFAQFYIAVLFTVIVFSIIALQQIVDMNEHRQKFIVLKQLGTDIDNLNRTLFWQVFLNFSIPVLMAVIFLLCSLYPLEQVLYPLLGNEHLLIKGTFIYMGIFAILYICYIMATYASLKKVHHTNHKYSYGPNTIS